MSPDLLKIIYVVPYKFVPPKNGGQNAAYYLLQFLAEKTSLSVISTPDNHAKNLPYNINPLLSSNSFRYINLGSLFAILKSFKSFRPDFCIMHQHFIFFLLWPITTLLGISKGIYVQNLEYLRFKSMRKWWWPIIYLSEWISYKLADGLFFISEAEIEPAIKSFQLDEAKCFLLPYGTNKLNDEPELTETVEEPSKERRIIFFGPLSYQPNLEALNTILYQIEPTLRSLSSDISYKFIICGGGLPEGFTISKSPFVSYLGYVQDIESMVRSSHIMINPITTGGGVKTKVIESIAWGTSVLSSRSGAMGIDSESCGAKLIQVEDNDYVGYAKEILRLLQEPKQPTPAIFYKKYFWGNIVEQFMIDLQSILTKNNL